MSINYGKKTFNNYHYSHNQLSADNPFRFIGTTFDPYQPKITNTPSQPYETKTANISQRKQPLSPYERNSYYNNNRNDNINENKPWSKTNSNSSLINNSYNILNNLPYNKNQRDHVGELLNYTNRDLPSYYSSNQNQNKKDSNYNIQNEKGNQESFNNYNNSLSSRTLKINSFQNNQNSNIGDKPINPNEFPSPYSNIGDMPTNANSSYKNQNKLFSPKKTNDQYNNNNSNKYGNQYNNNNNYQNKNSSFNNYNNDNERFNRNSYSNNNNKKYNNDEKTYEEEKFSNIELSEYSDDNCIPIKSYAYKENANSTYRDYMEDKSRVIQNIKGDPNSYLFCLFDGHGGKEVSQYLQSNFYTYFKEMLPFDNVKENLISLFKKIDNKIKESNFFNVGATACIIYITKENGQKCLYSANIGDTRSVLLSLNEYRRLSYDHRASDNNENKRIIDSGGIVFAGRVYGTLMLSRSFGDWELKPYGVSNEPHVTRINITDNDKYVIVASDGIWDVLEDIDVFNMSKNMNNAKDFCNKIVQQAIENGSMDNISCFVIKLN